MKFILTLLTFVFSNLAIFAENPLIVAHRGASKQAPENTLPAFNLAWEQGADAIEADFHLTKDGHIVCIHDSNTKKYTDQKLTISKSTLAALRKLDVGKKKGEKYKGTFIPTIAEVFSTIPDEKLIYIEIKCGKEIIPTLFEQIKKSKLKDKQIVIISFKENILKEIKLQAPQFKTLWLNNLKKDKAGNIPPSILETLKAIKADGISASKNTLNGEYIKTLHKNGFEYHVWTINDQKAADRFQKAGVQSITTDVPGVLKVN